MLSQEIETPVIEQRTLPNGIPFVEITPAPTCHIACVGLKGTRNASVLCLHGGRLFTVLLSEEAQFARGYALGLSQGLALPFQEADVDPVNPRVAYAEWLAEGNAPVL
jgi:hypothetical protein